MHTTFHDLIYSFINSIDLVNYLLKNHHRRTAVISWHLGKAYGLGEKQLCDLVFAASLHDIGALTVEERDQLIHLDINNPHPHARLGSYMLSSFDLFKKISTIVFYHHWPYSLHTTPITDVGDVPIEAYLLHLADRIEISIDSTLPIILQTDTIKNKLHACETHTFHPDAIAAFDSIYSTDTFWLDIDNKSMHDLFQQLSFSDYNIVLSIDLLEQFAYTCARIIDCRCCFTASHSYGVSEVAYTISKMLGYNEEKARKMRVAGLLHDIGKIAVSNELIRKPEPLSPSERRHVQTHAYYTHLILKDIAGLEDITEWACHHHECHDGQGYPDCYTDNMITQEMDILAYADIFTALAETRPYRDSMSIKDTIDTLNHFSTKHGEEILEIIRYNRDLIYRICKNAISDGMDQYILYEEFSNRCENETNQYISYLAL